MHRLSAVVILANILQVRIDTVSVDLALKTRGEDSIERRSAPLDTELDDWRIGRVFTLIVGGWIPELDDVITACCNGICNGLLVPHLRDEVCGDE